jgi:hypothetical protein
LRRWLTIGSAACSAIWPENTMSGCMNPRSKVLRCHSSCPKDGNRAIIRWRDDHYLSSVPKLDLDGCRVLHKRFCQQMYKRPKATLAYLKSRDCKIGGVTLGERGMLWYGGPQGCDLTGAFPFLRNESATQAALETFSRCLHLFLPYPNPHRGGRIISVSRGLPQRSRSNTSATRPDCPRFGD